MKNSGAAQFNKGTAATGQYPKTRPYKISLCALLCNV